MSTTVRATSLEALRSIEPVLSDLELQVYNELRAAGDMGLTRDGISALSGILIQTVCGRVLALIEANLVYESDKVRPTRSGRQARVLRVLAKEHQLSLL